MRCITLPKAAAIFAASGSIALGAGFFIPVQDPFALSRGNTFVGDASSPAAVYYNPAGLTQLERPELQIGFYNIHIRHEAKTSGRTSVAEQEWQTIPQFYYAHPLNATFTLGFGLNTPFGLGTQWGMNTPFRTVSTNAQLTYATFWSVLAAEVNPQLSLGVGIGTHYADALIEQGVGILPNDEFTFKGDDIGISWLLSLHWKPHAQHSFGLTYRSQTDFTLSGSAETNGTGGFFPIGSRESAKFDLITPATAAFGYKYQISDHWTLAADIEWVNFSQLKTSTVKTNSLNLPFVFNWEDSFVYGIGASRKFDNGYKIAFGYTFVESSVPDSTFNPAIDDADRHWLTMGFGRDLPDSSWFLGYQYAFSNRSVTRNPPNIAGETANGRYEVDAHSISVSYSKKF